MKWKCAFNNPYHKYYYTTNMDLRKEIEPLKSLEEVLDWLPPDPQPHSSPWQPRSSLHLSGASWRAGDRSWDTLVATPLTRGGPGKASCSYILFALGNP